MLAGGLCAHALGTRAAMLLEATAARRGGAVARVAAEPEDTRKDWLARRQHLGSGPVELALTALYLVCTPPRRRAGRGPTGRAAPRERSDARYVVVAVVVLVAVVVVVVVGVVVVVAAVVAVVVLVVVVVAVVVLVVVVVAVVAVAVVAAVVVAVRGQRRRLMPEKSAASVTLPLQYRYMPQEAAASVTLPLQYRYMPQEAAASVTVPLQYRYMPQEAAASVTLPSQLPLHYRHITVTLPSHAVSVALPSHYRYITVTYLRRLPPPLHYRYINDMTVT